MGALHGGTEGECSCLPVLLEQWEPSAGTAPQCSPWAPALLSPAPGGA